MQALLNLLSFSILIFSLGCTLDLKIDSPPSTVEFTAELDLLNGKIFSGVYYLNTQAAVLKPESSDYTHFKVTSGEICSESSSLQEIPSSREINHLLTSSSDIQQRYAFQFFSGTGAKGTCLIIPFVVDSSAPALPSIAIHADILVLSKEYIASPLLRISASAIDVAPIEVLLSENSTCSNGQWQSLSPFIIFPSSAAHGVNTQIYAKFRDLLGNESACVSSNTVVLDIEGPVVDNSSVLVSGLPYANPVVVYSTTIDLSLSATDKLLSEMKITANADCSGGTYEKYSSTKSGWTLANVNNGDRNSISVIFKDRFGNESTCRPLTVEVEGGGPSGSFTIASQSAELFGQTFLSSGEVTLNVTYSNADEVQFYGDSSCMTAIPGFPTAPSASMDITIGADTGADDGAKTIAAQFKQTSSGKVSTCFSKSVILDTQAPTDTDIYPWMELPVAWFEDDVVTGQYNRHYYTRDNSITLQASATDSSLKEFYFTTGLNCTGTRESISYHGDLPSKEFHLSSDGIYEFSAQFFDVFDRPSTCYTLRVVRDNTSATAPTFVQPQVPLMPMHMGSLTETPRFFLNDFSANTVEKQTTSSSGFRGYEARLVNITANPEAEIVSWKNFEIVSTPNPLNPNEIKIDNIESFVFSNANDDRTAGYMKINGFSLIEGDQYRFELRSYDILGNKSPSGFIDFIATAYNVIPPSNTTCDTGYTYIPADPAIKSAAFCVAKYEMKKVKIPEAPGTYKAVSQHGSEVFIDVTRAQAAALCAQDGKRLISNNEWNAIARNIAAVDHNWSKDGDG